MPRHLSVMSAWGALSCRMTMATAQTDAAAYEQSYRDKARFLQCCQACHRYGLTYACPPFPDDDAIAFPDGATMLIVGSRLIPDSATRELATDVQRRDGIMHALLDTALPVIERLHRQWENECPDSRAFLFSTCRLCHPQSCTRPEGKPCRHPEKVRPSLEALGFNLARTADELFKMPLQWSSDERLPDYLTLITAQLLPKHTDIVRQTADDTV